MSSSGSNVATVIDMIFRSFQDLEPGEEQEEELAELSTLLGDNNIDTSILKRRNEDDYAFTVRSFSELLRKLPSDLLNTYKKKFFRTYGAPYDIDLLIEYFTGLAVEKQEVEIGKLSELTGGGRPVFKKSPKESEEDFRIRCFFELLLKLPIDSVNSYQSRFYDTYGRRGEGRCARESRPLYLDDEAPPGFNPDYKPPTKKK